MTTTVKSKQFATCARCGAQLTNPVSVAIGVGPICRGKAKGAGGASGYQPGAGGGGSEHAARQVYLDIPLGRGIVLQRLEGDMVATNVPWLISHHSPNGFEWGYPGSGPADLALNIAEVVLLADGHTQPGRKAKASGWGTFFRDAWNMHQPLKDRFIVGVPKEGGVIPLMEVVEWVRDWKSKPQTE